MEYKKTQSEIKTSSEYRNAGMEYTSTGKEYFSPSGEYKSVAKEIHFEGEEACQETSQKEQKSRRRMMSKKVRQMGYLVAATAAVVMVSQTVPETNTGNHWYDDEYVSDYDDVGLGGNDDYVSPDDDGNYTGDFSEGDSYIEDFEGMIPFEDGASFFGIANAGLFPVSGDGDWRLVDYSGNTIAGGNWEYDNLFNSPTNSGYTIFQNIEDKYWAVLNSQGEVVYRREYTLDNWSDAWISDDILYISRYEEASGKIWLEYRTLAGDVLCDSMYSYSDGLIFEYTYPFMDGMAVFTAIDKENDYEHVTYSLSKNGIVTEVSRDYLAGTPNVDGYYMSPGKAYYKLEIGSYGTTGGVFYLVDSKTGEPVSEIDIIPFLKNVMGIEEESIHRTISFNAYEKEGVRCISYDSYACLAVYDSRTDETFDILFDFKNTDADRKVNSKIATYEDILFDNYPYLCVFDGTEYYYIDLSGNVVAGPYKNATSFTDTGYTMVTEMDGTTNVLNSSFEVVDTISKITEIDTYGDVFIVERGPDSLYWKYMYVPGEK